MVLFYLYVLLLSVAVCQHVQSKCIRIYYWQIKKNIKHWMMSNLRMYVLRQELLNEIIKWLIIKMKIVFRS